MSKEYPSLTAPPSCPSVLHHQRLNQLTAFVRTSEQILDTWDTYSDQHTDPDGWPHDEDPYGHRAARRDAETWEAAAQIRPFARDLLSTAAVQLQHLPARTIQPAWPWHLTAADDALDQLDAVEADWSTHLDSLPPGAGPGTAAYDNLVDARNAEAWHALNELTLHTQAILAIHAAAQAAPPRLDAVAPRPTPTTSTSPAAVARR
ncbi:hypothetical protein ACWD3I_29775 [Streptomyces sp. NPDC002817]|uniref:hypothetical protein n=1 Tax=Streptomyces sp. NPDC088357 TaxID=3154655 RepID=UPI00342DF6C0